MERLYITKINTKNDLNKISYLFDDIRFHMGKSVLDGKMGEAYVDSIESPKFAYLLVRKYCFISGDISNNNLKQIIEDRLKGFNIIPSNSIKNKILKLFNSRLKVAQRHSIDKNPQFDIDNLKDLISKLDTKYRLRYIDNNLERKIREKKFITITDNYEKNGIGVCCLLGDNIVGVASSNIFYSDGIEVNIKVDEKFRCQGIASAMASMLIIKCIEMNKTISWDAKTMISVKLAEKLGFKYHSSYEVFTII